ncbi:MAG: S8 family serine peptidase [Dehalococcoidia bacterium]
MQGSAVNARRGVYRIAIGRVDATEATKVHLFIDFGPCLVFCPPQTLALISPAGSLRQPADNPNVLAVGAVNHALPNLVEPFSSQGPTDDGRKKPDLVAADGVSTNTSGSAPLFGFFGTFASAPHVAGAAARGGPAQK